MVTELTVPEPNVLIVKTFFLIEHGVTRYKFSVAAGRRRKRGQARIIGDGGGAKFEPDRFAVSSDMRSSAFICR